MTDGGPVVLALRALGLGDALTGVPALRGLRRAFPGHRLVLAAPAGVGGWLRDLGRVRDEPAALRRALADAAAGADVVLVSGGISVNRAIGSARVTQRPSALSSSYL